MLVPQNTIKFINELKKKNIDFRAERKIVILNSNTADYTFDDKLLNIIYDMTKLPFQVPEDIHEFAALAKLYYNQIKLASYLPYQIIKMNYNEITSELLNNLRNNNAEMSYISNWQFYAFFLEDEYIKDEKMLGIKLDEIVSMLDYPFIKKYEYPLRHKITFDYLYQLIHRPDIRAYAFTENKIQIIFSA